MKIRIGNDIKLVVRLVGTMTIPRINIQSMKAYLINTNFIEEYKKRTASKTKFLSRYPLEPMIAQYTSTSYNLNASGYPTYRAFPHRHVHATYGGFGVTPYWEDHYLPVANKCLGEYLAKVKATENKDVVEVYFPAEAQFYPGTYKLVIVAKVYDPGFDDTNLRTVTVDYNNIFTLVKSTNDEGSTDSAVELLVNGQQTINDDSGDIYVNGGVINPEGKIELSFSGSNQTVKIDTSDEFVWGEYQ